MYLVINHLNVNDEILWTERIPYLFLEKDSTRSYISALKRCNVKVSFDFEVCEVR